MAITVERYGGASELRQRDLAAVTRIYNDVWREWLPGEPLLTDAALLDVDRFSAPPERMERVLARDAHGDLVGNAAAFWREGPGGCTLRAFVDPSRRREGVGAAMGAALAAIAMEAGRDGLAVEVAPGSAAESAVRARDGFRPDLTMELNRTDVRNIDPRLLERWRAHGEAAPGYSLVAYDAPCPDDDLAEDFCHARQVMNDAPRAEVEAEASYTVPELRAVEAAGAAAHQDWWSVGVRQDATGELVGLCELYLPRSRPWIVFQGDTGVHPDHRGHGLGAWMKAVNHQRLAAERPEVDTVQTWNADSNEPMLRINRALGFEAKQRFQTWHRPLP
jgi:GNAT superfamily N-acetyltransferase